MTDRIGNMHQTVFTTHRRTGFTLIELMVVISIIGLLIGILLPSLAHVRRYSQRVACAATLKQVGIGWVAYSEDYPRSLPHAVSLPDANEQVRANETTFISVMRNYIDNPQAYRCPSDDRNYFQDHGISYEYQPAHVLMESMPPFLEQQVMAFVLQHPAQSPILSDAEVFHPTSTDPSFRQTLFYDGHVSNLGDASY